MNTTPSTSRPTVVRHATVLTMDEGAPRAEAFSYQDGRILDVGAEADVLAAAGDAHLVDADGCFVVPGFIDAHHHLSLGLLYEPGLACGPSIAPTLRALLRCLADHAASLPPHAWVVARGFDTRHVAERRYPTQDELDAACPHHPMVMLHYSFHECLANRQAMNALGIDRHTPDPQGGWIERDRRGRPTGRLVEKAMTAAELRARRELVTRDAGRLAARLERYQHSLFEAGLTRIADATVSPDLEAAYGELASAGALRIPIVLMPVGESGYLSLPSDRLGGRPTGEGPEHLRIGPLKLFADGAELLAVSATLSEVAGGLRGSLMQIWRTRSLRPLSAARRMSMTLDRDFVFRAGIRLLPGSGAEAVARDAVERGFSLAIHANGNQAVQDAFGLLRGVRQRHPDSPPPRIEHALLCNRDLLRGIASEGIQLVCQPDFLMFAEGAESPLAGLPLLPLRWALDAGVRVAGSSDAPVVRFRPLEAMGTAVTRRYGDGPVLHPEQAITPMEALAMYTREAARACGSLAEAGTLARGKRADYVVLRGDPTRVSAYARGELGVVRTVVAGEVVYESSGSSSGGGNTQ